MSTPNNSWTPQKEQLLHKWYKHARVYGWLHAKAATHKQWWYTRTFYLTIILSSLGLAQNFGVFFSDDEETTKAIQIANTTIITLIGILNIYLKTSKLAELVEKHTNTSKEFYALQTEIEEQLAQDAQERQNGTNYIKKIRIKQTTLTKESPEIVSQIWKKYKVAVENGEIFAESDPSIIYEKADAHSPITKATPQTSPTVKHPAQSVSMDVKTTETFSAQKDDNIEERTGKILTDMQTILNYQEARFN